MSYQRWTAWLMSAVIPRRDQSVPVRFQDERGRRGTVVVRRAEGGVQLEGSGLGQVHLSVNQVDQLRAALRSAVLDLDRLGDDDPSPLRSIEIPQQRSDARTSSDVDRVGG